MRGLLAGAALACLGAPAAGAQVMADGYLHYGMSHVTQTVQCSGTPIALDGDETDMSLVGACTHVRVTGERNLVSVDVVPRGLIEITGQHNDVTWRQLRPGPPPVLHALGAHNQFHAGARGR